MENKEEKNKEKNSSNEVKAQGSPHNSPKVGFLKGKSLSIRNKSKRNLKVVTLDSITLPNQDSPPATPEKKRGERSQTSPSSLSNILKYGTFNKQLLEKVDLSIEVDFESLIQSDTVRKFPIQELVKIPEDVKAFSHSRKPRYHNGSVPTEFDPQFFDASIKTCVDIYCANYYDIRKENSKFSVFAYPANLNLEELPDEPYEIDSEYIPRTEAIVEQFEEAETLANKFIKQSIQDLAKENFKKRNSFFFNIFEIFPSSPKELNFIQPPEEAKPFLETSEYQLFVKCNKFSFALGDLEPYFCSLTIFDISKRTRVTETFWFDVSDDFRYSLLGKTIDEMHPITRAQEAIFHLVDRNPHHVLIVTVEKVLQGHIEDAVEKYSKHGSIKEKDRNSVMEQIRVNISRHGSYRQLFAWGMLELFDDGGDLILDLDSEYKATGESSIELYPAKSDNTHPFNNWEDIDLKKLKPISGVQCKFLVRLLKRSEADKLEPDTVRVNSSNSFLNPIDMNKVDLTSNSKLKFQREIPYFTEANTELRPYISYVNNLYIYPESLNLNVGFAKKNIVIQITLLDNDQNVEEPHGIQAIYARSAGQLFHSTTYTSVVYHQKKPIFYDEIKIRVPANVTQSLHILFTFYHVPVKSKKPKQLLGYSILPIYPGRILPNRSHSLPIATSLPAGYLDPYKDVKWMENKKPLFFFRTIMESSIFPQDAKLNAFLKQYHMYISQGLASFDQKNFVLSLYSSKPQEIIRFFPVVLRELFDIMCSPKLNPQASQILFQGFISMLKSLRELEKKDGFFHSPLFSSYVKYFSNSSQLHEILVKCWLTALRATNPIKKKLESKDDTPDDTWQFSLFLFELIKKSMIVFLGEKVPERSTRFSKDFTENLSGLVFALAAKIQQLADEKNSQLFELNKSLAFFVKGLLSIMDRGVLFALIQKFVLVLNPNCDNDLLHIAKLEFLAIISSHEHFIALNLPLEPLFEFLPSLVYSSHYIQYHFLAGLLLREINSSFNPEFKNKEEIYSKAIIILRNLLRKHDLDPRYQDKVKKQYIASIYFPYLTIVIDNLEAISQMKLEEKQKWLICWLYILRNCKRELLREWYKRDTERRQSRFFKVLSIVIESFEYTGRNKLLEKVVQEQSSSPTLSKPQTVSTQQRKGFIESIYGVQTEFETREQSSALYNYYRRSSTGGPLPNLQQSLDGKRQFGVNAKRLLSHPPNLDKAIKQESHLCKEASITVIDTIADFIEELEEFNPEKTVFFSELISLFVLLLQRNQSHFVVLNFLEYLRIFLEKFKFKLFSSKDTANELSSLTYELVRICNSSSEAIFKESSVLLYLFIKENFNVVNNFSRMRLNVSLSVSKLVGPVGHIDDGNDVPEFNSLRTSLKFITSFAKHYDSEIKDHQAKYGTFITQLGTLINRLFAVLRDCRLLSQSRNDPELTADLYYQISNGYADSPELRATWLEHLYYAHKSAKNFEEAGQALMAKIVLVTDYINNIVDNKSDGFPVKTSFTPISPNVMKEIAVDFSHKEDSIIHSPEFSEESVMNMLQTAVQLFKSAELFELCLLTSNIQVEYYQKQAEYEKLIEIYRNLEVTSRQLVETKNTRFFSNYYRVGFFGKKFDDLDGQQFIYKEPKSVLLPQMVKRLKKQLQPKVSKVVISSTEVKVLPNTLDETELSQLDPNKCYFQVVSVQPYFDPQEEAKRKTEFQKKFNIDTFIFETPFTKSGIAQTDDIKQQYKRKTILKVELAFPYLKKRLRVIEKKELILTPIENAIELIRNRTKALRHELKLTPPDAKSLQNILQGSILARKIKEIVNAGPLRICEVFLGPNQVEYPEGHVQTLRETMDDFIKVCGDAIRLNSELIKSDQYEFQHHLQQAYNEFKRQLSSKFSQRPSLSEKKTISRDTSLDKISSIESVGSEKSSPVRSVSSLNLSDSGVQFDLSEFLQVKVKSDVFVKILLCLDVEDICRLGRTSKQLYQLVKDDTLWKQFVKRDFHYIDEKPLFVEPEVMSWYDFYKKILTELFPLRIIPSALPKHYPVFTCTLELRATKKLFPNIFASPSSIRCYLTEEEFAALEFSFKTLVSNGFVQNTNSACSIDGNLGELRMTTRISRKSGLGQVRIVEALIWLGILESEVQHSVVVHIPFEIFVKHVRREINQVKEDWAQRPKPQLDEIPPPPPDDDPYAPKPPTQQPSQNQNENQNQSQSQNQDQSQEKQTSKVEPIPQAEEEEEEEDDPTFVIKN